MLAITRRWLAECVVLKDNSFVQLLMLVELANGATDRIYGAIVQSAQGAPVLKPVLRAYDQVASTRYVDIVCLDDGHGQEDLLNLIVEVTGEQKKDKAAKVLTATTQWVPAVNNHGGFGRWAFVEITDPWDAVNTIRGVIGG